jgi:hypothetical protein
VQEETAQSKADDSAAQEFCFGRIKGIEMTEVISTRAQSIWPATAEHPENNSCVNIVPMHFLSKRLIASVCVALMMILAHYEACASDALFRFNSYSGNYYSTPAASCASMGFPLGDGPNWFPGGLLFHISVI